MAFCIMHRPSSDIQVYSSICGYFVSLLLFISLQGKKITVWRDLTKLNVCKTNVAAFKHPAAVTKCVFSKGCKYLATYAADGVLRVFMVSVFGKDLKRFFFFRVGGGSVKFRIFRNQNTSKN